MHEVLDGLTVPLDEADLQGLSFERTTPRVLEPDTEDHPHRHAQTKPWSFCMRLTRDRQSQVFEYACHEGNDGCAKR